MGVVGAGVEEGSAGGERGDSVEGFWEGIGVGAGVEEEGVAVGVDSSFFSSLSLTEETPPPVELELPPLP